MYNLSNLEPKFKSFLSAENISNVTLRNYLSDVRHFLGWLFTQPIYRRKENLINNLASLNHTSIQNYKDHHLNSHLPVKTINRRLSALRKFFLFCQKETILIDNPAKKINNISLIKRIDKPVKQVDVQQPKTNEFPSVKENELKIPRTRNTEFNFVSFFAILAIIPLLGILYFSLLRFSSGKTQPEAVSNPVKTSSRYMAFSGKFLDNLGNPITTKTDATFNLYSVPIDGKPIYTVSCVGQTGAITPDVNGNVHILLGSDCDGKPIPNELFSDNPNIYLGVTLASDKEMLPRQHIPNVGYANNSDTLQGLNIGTQNLSVPFINQSGDLLIGAPDSGIRSTYQSSNFSISSADTVTIESADLGDVVLQATESGTIKLRTGGFSDSYTRITINNEGNIGIGTLFPTYGFEVNDDVKITSGNRLILASSSADPSGESGAMYYNIQTNKFRCFQGGTWLDCIGNSNNSPIGGIYDGTLTNGLTSDYLSAEITKLNKSIGELKKEVDKIGQTATSTVQNLSSNLTNLSTNYISVREKITSPVVESNQIQTTEIKANDKNLILNLAESDQNGAAEAINASENKGVLASLIIKGLAGKTAALIDAAGNASFSGQLAAETLLINKDATIAGSLRAGKIESENINNLEQGIASLSSEFTDLSQNNSISMQQWDNDLNNIQKLLAEIKDQPLANPQYYQNLDTDQLPINNDSTGLNGQMKKLNNLILDKLTVSGTSNIYNLAVAGSGTVGNLLLQDSSILSLAWDLKLSALANVKIFDDAVVISKDGNIAVKGKIIAQDGIKTNKVEPLNEGDKVTINNLVVDNLTVENKYLEASASSNLIAAADNFKQNGISSPAIETKTASAGKAFIPQNSLEIIIYNSNVRDNSLIYLTPTTPVLDSTLTVSDKNPCNGQNKETACRPYFKVLINKSSISPVSFNWLIIN